MRIGVLTGGGDVPGLNAAIRAVARRAFQYGWEVVGIRNGWQGMVEGIYEPLTPKSVSGILHVGGTILGTSRTNPLKDPKMMEKVFANFKAMQLDGLVAIGGDDTLSVAAALAAKGLPAVGVPKTMDNDVAETDYCIGFDTATTTVADALDKLHTTATAHHRVIVVEVMGRDAGWVAVVGGLAGGADFIAVPESPTNMDAICTHLKNRRDAGKNFAIVVVAEGAKITDLPEPEDLGERDAFGHVRLDKRSLGERVAKEIEKRIGFEARTVVLGHLQRGGSPSVFDRVLATRLGVFAVDLIREGRFGYMAALKGNKIVPVELEHAVASNKKIDLELYELAKVFF
ncbi:MAG: 6-phosphofructokinase [Chloroflexi bacterium]|nr:6-phosphofructokinase [Chloroflexota bacterium]